MSSHPKTTHKPRSRDTGSISLFVIIICLVMFAAIGLVIDGSTRLRAASHATTSAQEAARAAGQALSGSAITGHQGTVNPSLGAAAAQSYLAQAGVRGTISITGDIITVTTDQSWHPTFLGAFGIGGSTLHGTATATTQYTGP